MYSIMQHILQNLNILLLAAVTVAPLLLSSPRNRRLRCRHTLGALSTQWCVLLWTKRAK